MKSKIIFLVIFFSLILNGICTTIFREAEDFDNLPYYGNWVETSGWYIKRHSHASGGAFVVSHKNGSKMYKKLKEEIPPGTYNVFLKIVLTRSANTENIFKVCLGNYDRRGKFIPESSGILIQDFTGSGYGWYPLKNTLTIKNPCKVVEVEAVKVENMGIGDDPEYEKPYAILDSIILTTEKVELLKDRSNRGRNRIKFLTGKDPREKVERIKYPVPEVEVNFSSLPPERKIFIPGKNILRNSSFEFNIKPFFTGSGYPIFSGDNVDNVNLCSENPYHGKYCLKLQANLQNLVESGYEGSKAKPIYGNTLRCFYMQQFFPKNLLSSSTYVLSFYLKTNGKKINFNGKEVSNTDWKRYTQNWKPGADLFKFTTSDPNAIVYLDAMQIEKGTTPAEYQPFNNLEVGFLINGSYAGIVHKGKFINCEISVSQGRGKSEKLEINYRILNPSLKIEYSGKTVISSNPGKVVTKKIKIPFSKLGNYILVYEVANHNELSYIIPFSVVENPEKFASLKPQLGAIISTNEEIMRIFKHAGFDWVNSLNDRLNYFSYIWPKYDEMHFYTKWYRMWEEKYGIQYSFWRPPFNPPSWAENILGKEPAAHMGKPNISYENWEHFWKIITKKLNYIKVWQPTDEQSYHRGPRESIPYIEIASKYIRKNIPDAIIMNSSQPRHFKEMLEIKPDLDIGDAFGGSRHNFERNSYFYDRELKRKLKKEYWVVGVGWTVAGWNLILNFETFVPNKEYFKKKFAIGLNKVAQSIFNEASIVGVERFGLYTAKFDAGHDPCSLFNEDNTITQFGINFINSINFLREHKPGDVILMDTAYGVFASYLYLRNGKVLVMIAPDGSYRKIKVGLNKINRRKVKLYDYNFNPIPYRKTIVLSVGENLYIEDNGLGKEKLLSSVSSLKCYPVNMERRVLLPDLTGKKIKLATFQVIKGKTVKTSEVELPEKAGLCEPIDQTRYGRNESWATVGKKILPDKIKIDGKLENIWEKAVPSFIYCWDALDGSYGALQGIKNFNNIYSLKDISATFKTLWDGDNIYLSFDILDNKIKEGDKLILKFDTDLPGDLNVLEFNEDDLTMLIKPIKNGISTYKICTPTGEVTGEATAGIKINKDGYKIEIKIPLSSLKIKRQSCFSIGLGVDVVDDDGEKTPSVLSWTGNYLPRKSPSGFGQMILLNTR